MDEQQKLTKKERKQLAKQKSLDEFEKARSKSLIIKIIIGIVTAIVIIGGGWWAIAQSTKPPPGTSVEEMGRDHVSDISGISYTSNPPTSGQHFPIWAKRGVYKQELSQGNLIHSLEHGYIVIDYDCGPKEKIPKKFSLAKGATLSTQKVQTVSKMEPFTADAPPPKETDLPESFAAKECKQLVDQLKPFLDDYQRIVIVPNPHLDAKIVVRAWGHIDKMDTFDKERIKTFIEAFHNKGPEQTIE